MRVALLALSGRAHDALGRQLADKLAFFQERGADVRVFLQETALALHPGLTGQVEIVEKVEATGPVWDFLASADLVIADYTQSYDLLQFLPLLAGGKPRLILDYHGVTPPELFPLHEETLRRGQSQRGVVWCCDAALAHSRFMADELHRATGFPSERILQIGFAVDEPPASRRVEPGGPHSDAPHGGAEPRRSPTTYGEPAGERITLLFVGRVAANKRVPVLIEAVARLRDHEPPVHAVIVGDMGDLYAEEAGSCLHLAQDLGVTDRVHFLGQVPDEWLMQLYQSADALVLPSLHEGFCVPVIEAMASGLPVIAARTSALPETIGDAGLTFTSDDVEDLARQVRRVVAPRARSASKGRIALVSHRFGAQIVGGAERSLRTMATALQRRGIKVEVFTTCVRAEGNWRDELPAGTTTEDGLPVHRFPIDPHDPISYPEAVRRIVEADGRTSRDDETAFIRESIHSTQLLETLRQRQDDFDAIITGPYLFGLTHDVAAALPDKTLLVPCFHDEPLARLTVWPEVYGRVGGVLYHSVEEKDFAEAVLGVNHPQAVVVGTWIPVGQGAARNASGAPRDVVYCGRYSQEKGLDRLLEYAQRYQTQKPGRFRFVFMGQGEFPLPRREWLVDLGRVAEETKQDVLAGAAALVQLSRRESLSLVTLEAWAAGIPVLVDSECAVLAGQVRRSQGGQACADYTEFAAALDDLWEHPETWRQRGEQGRAYVEANYSSESAYERRLLQAVDGLAISLREHMRRRGLERAAQFRRDIWRERFGQLVETTLDAVPRPWREEIAIQPYQTAFEVQAGTRHLLIALRLTNHGHHAAAAEGPGQTRVWFQVVDAAGEGLSTPLAAELPALLLPGQTQSAAITLTPPPLPGAYRVLLWASRSAQSDADGVTLALTVGEGAASKAGVDAILDLVRSALAEAEHLKRLPDDYLDVSEGRLARFKRWLKSKLLGNFKRAYVDVLSRRQSQVNQQLLTAVQQLAECCATLDHALRGLQDRAGNETANQTAAEPAEAILGKEA